MSVAYLLLEPAARAQPYQTPPEVMAQALQAEMRPTASVSPDRGWVLLGRRSPMPDIERLAVPTVNVNRALINLRTNGPPSDFPLAVDRFDLVRIRDRQTFKVEMPGGESGQPLWSPDAKRFLFWHARADGYELWMGEVTTARARRLMKAELNVVHSGALVPCSWFNDSRHAVCQTIPKDRGPLPDASAPRGPEIQESSGKFSRASLYAQRLKTEYSEEIYEYVRRAQAVVLDTDAGVYAAIGKPAIYAVLNPSPDGQYLLSVRVVPPYSSLLQERHFAREVEVLSVDHDTKHSIASIPVQWPSAANELRTARQYAWRPDAAATVVYTEAWEGEPRTNGSSGDRIMLLTAPFNGAPRELFHSSHRIEPEPPETTDGSFRVTGDVFWLHDGLAWIEETNARPSKRVWLVDARKPTEQPRLLANVAAHETPVLVSDGRQERLVEQDGEWIYLKGKGSAAEDFAPCLDRFNIRTQRRMRLFQSVQPAFEEAVGVLNRAGMQLLIRSESRKDPPAHFVYDVSQQKRWALYTPDKAPSELTDIKIEQLSYHRRDGVALTGTLYLPVGYDGRHPLPAVLFAYPLRFGNASSASEALKADSERSIYPWAQWSNVRLAVRLLVTQGYAVLDFPGMPIVSNSGTDVEQLIADASAAIDELVKKGVADRTRIGLAGHSGGGVLAATLLAQSKLFAAGVAINGGYNLTTVPFGVEEQSLWEARDAYIQMSAALNADKIAAPLLLIHGASDDNFGTQPADAQRMYEAAAVLGKTVRLVMLPYEGHAPRARESCLHMAWEILTWFDRYLKADPNPAYTSAAK